MIRRTDYYLFFVILMITLFSGIPKISFATHNRAGEITLRQIDDLSFEITITTFTFSLSAADRSELEVQWGDNTTSVAPRVEKVLLPANFYNRNVYITTHTYPGPGTYEVVVQDPNRNFGVKNIPNSVNIIFSIKTIITVNPSLGQNSTPVLLNPPIDRAAYLQPFIHNPAAFDIDGDSISYELTVCTEEDGQPIEDYTFPDASDTLYVDPVSGDLVWDSPVDTGIFNIAMNIAEWRDGVKIGNIARDMQIEVFRTNNNLPKNDSIPDFCIVAGEKLEVPIRSTDIDGDSLTHFLTGGPFAFDDDAATYTLVSRSPGELISTFTWQTSCLHPRRQPYDVIVKTEDNNRELSLIDITNFSVTVSGPGPDAPVIAPSSVSAVVRWNSYDCSNIQGYRIYRKEGRTDYQPDPCSPGIPDSLGYELIGETFEHRDTSFLDNNDGTGLLQGIEYCYRITAILSDGSESLPSEESCANLTPGSPSILNTSVTEVAENGSIFLSWAKILDLDTIAAPGPYTYLIYRSDDLWAEDPELIDSLITLNLNDTTYTDLDLNTVLFPYSYQVELYNNEPGNRFLVGDPEVAASFYPEVVPGDNKIRLNVRRNVPWLIDSFLVYRTSGQSESFELAGSTTEEFYVDENLKNGVNYCYYLVAEGRRDIYGSLYKNQNVSHLGCGVPIDNEPPCPPDFDVQSNCDSSFNRLSWFYRENDLDCSEDVVKYRIYYTPDFSIPYLKIDSIDERNVFEYIHYPEEGLGLAASYYITAVDSFNNESERSLIITVDDCIKYTLPNVFSPNGDGINDFYRPIENQDVERVDMKVFNRWGQLVFETEDPEINWNGKHRNSNDLVAPGVYYYICDVFERRISGVEIRNLVGFIHVYHEKGATNFDEIQDR